MQICADRNPLRRDFSQLRYSLVISPALLAMCFSMCGQGVVRGAFPLTFTNAPPAVEWATASAPGTSSTFIDATALDAAVQTNAAAGITSILGTTGVLPPAVAGLARWNSAGEWLQTRSGGNAYTMLLGIFRNDSARMWNVVTITYDQGAWPSAGAEIEESIPGHRVFWSLTGEPNSWTLIPELSGQSGTTNVGATISCNVFWNPDAVLYLLWVDDNGPVDSAAPLCEGGYTIDNFSISCAYAESGCWANAPSTVVERMPFTVYVLAGTPCADIERIDLQVDGELYASSNRWSANFIVTDLPLGRHTISAIATDTLGGTLMGFPAQVTVVSNTLHLAPVQARYGAETNAFEFNIRSPAEQRVVLEASPDLQGWTPLRTNYVWSQPLPWSDKLGVTNAQRFYRAKYLP